MDGTTYRTLFGVSVFSLKDTALRSRTTTDGSYLLSLQEGYNTITYYLEGFQQKIITQTKIKRGQVLYLDILLYPTAKRLTKKDKHQSKDSLRVRDSVTSSHSEFVKESLLIKYNPFSNSNGFYGDAVTAENISPGNFKNGTLLLKRLNGVILQDNPANPMANSFIISAMGERYNQLMFNGAPLPYFNNLTRAYPTNLMPIAALEEVSVQKNTSGSIPGDFAGGTIEIKTKDHTDSNFYFIQAGAGFSSATTGLNFYGDKRSQFEFLGFSGSQRNLPSLFPTTRSLVPFASKNLQEQVDLSKQLKNNLGPQNYGNAAPNEKFSIGIGKNYTLKKGAKLSLLAFLNHSKDLLFTESFAQVRPNVSDNPYPFTDVSKQLIFAQAKDSNYNYSSQVSGIINVSLIFRKNKISFRNFLGSQFSNTYTRRTGIYKPDEDTLAHTGVNYLATQKYFINTQLAGEHILSPNGKFKMEWQATYTYINQQNPDERNFLLRQDISGSKFELATPLTDNAFTNSGRLWSNFKDNSFSASFKLSLPFNLFKQPQVLSGGIYVQQNYRISNSDMLQVKGKGYASLNDLLAPERYYPDGVSVTSFYVNQYVSVINFISAGQQSKANYSAASNSGASFVSWGGRLSNKVSMQLGIRAEANTQLASDIYYSYTQGYRNPQFYPLYENTKINKNSFLPSANIVLTPVNWMKLYAGYFKSVNRPQLQELVLNAYYDAASFMVKTGNPLLGTSTISNYTAGVNLIANAFSGITLSAYYKKLDQPIEYIVSNYSKGNMLYTPHNTPPATVKGLEAALKLKLNFLKVRWLSGVSLFANGNINDAKAEAGPVRSASTPQVTGHTLSGTPKYSLNCGLTVQQPGYPELTVMYSRIGDYVSALGSGKSILLGNGNSILAIPDYRIKGREQLDIQIAQKIFKSKFQIIAGVNNLLDNPFVTYQDLNGNKKFDSPLVVQNTNGQGGFYKSGTDNTISYIKSQSTYYVTISWLFK